MDIPKLRKVHEDLDKFDAEYGSTHTCRFTPEGHRDMKLAQLLRDTIKALIFEPAAPTQQLAQADQAPDAKFIKGSLCNDPATNLPCGYCGSTAEWHKCPVSGLQMAALPFKTHPDRLKAEGLVRKPWNPIETAPSRRLILVTGPSGYVTHKHYACAAYLDPDRKEFFDVTGVRLSEKFGDEGAPTHWKDLGNLPGEDA